MSQRANPEAKLKANKAPGGSATSGWDLQPLRNRNRTREVKDLIPNIPVDRNPPTKALNLVSHGMLTGFLTCVVGLLPPVDDSP